MTPRRLAPPALLLTLALAGCASAPPPPPDPRPAAEAAIRQADENWAKAAATLNPDAWMAFYADDAVVLPPNEKRPATRDELRKSIAALLGLPGLQITWKADKIEVAQSGELGYLHGAYQMSFDGGKGKPRVTDTGKILEVWKKQADGSWKCVADAYSSDLPAAPAQ